MKDSSRNKKPTIVIITHYFPFSLAEQFLVEEILAWGQRDDVTVVLAPLNIRGQSRPIPPSVQVDLQLAHSAPSLNLFSKLREIFQALTNRLFLAELRLLWSKRRLRPSTLLSALSTTRTVLHYQAPLRSLCKRLQVDLAYCYWNDAVSYATVSLKEEGSLQHVVCRVHGFDLYEERARGGHHSLKRYFLQSFSKIFCLSKAAANYLLSTYGSPQRLEVRPLGVHPPPHPSPTPVSGVEFHIVSCSNCVPVKRLERVIEALTLVAQQLQNNHIHWTHIGGGELFELHHNQAKASLDNLENVSFTFLGAVPNQKIQDFYTHHEVFAFINVSDSEGVPVSMLEAMAYGIPAIAPDIGGIKTALKHHVNGYLMPAFPTGKEIARALFWLANCSPEQIANLRQAARQTILDDFDSRIVFPGFVEAVVKQLS